jgi:RNA polymerase sigma-70 factor (ECF subfamily)
MVKDSTAPASSGATCGDDDTLVARACTGDMVAFGRLVAKYQDRVLNTCWRICGNREDAQDLAQEAFLHALRAIGSYRRRSAFYTWLFRIAVNASIAHRRKRARAPKLSLHGNDGRRSEDHQAARLVGRVSRDPQDPIDRLSARELERELLAGLEQLDDERRAVVILRDIEGFDYRQIAEMLEIEVGTVKSRLHRARMELRDRLRHKMEEAAR